MKSQHIPEHKMNVTTTAGEAVENMTSKECSQTTASAQGNQGSQSTWKQTNK